MGELFVESLPVALAKELSSTDCGGSGKLAEPETGAVLSDCSIHSTSQDGRADSSSTITFLFPCPA